MTQTQKIQIIILLHRKGKTIHDLYRAIVPFQQKREEIQGYTDLTIGETNVLIQALENLPDRTIQEELLL